MGRKQFKDSMKERLSVFWKINKIDKLLAELTKKKKKTERRPKLIREKRNHCNRPT